MAEWNAREAEKAALPCPFCGERLVVCDDHHGEWLGHKTDGCFEDVSQILNAEDLERWNRRLDTPARANAEKMLQALKEAVEFGDAMDADLTPAGKNMVDRWRAIIAAAEGRNDAPQS